MGKRELANYVDKILDTPDRFNITKPERLDDIVKLEEKVLYSDDKFTYKYISMEGYDKQGNIGYQDAITVNDYEIYLDTIKPNKTLVIGFDDILFLINDGIVAIPYDYIFISAASDNPSNKLYNLLYDNARKQDIDRLLVNIHIAEEFQKKVDKRVAISNKKMRIKRFLDQSGFTLLSALTISLAADLSGTPIIFGATLGNAALMFLNYLSIYKGVKIDLNYSTEANLNYIVYKNHIAYVNDRVFYSPNKFTLVKDIEDNIIAESENVKLHYTKTTGFIDDELVSKFALFINEIEFYNGDYIEGETNITTYDDSLYIFGSEFTYIPFPYILESLYEDDPVLALNEMLDQNVKCLKR